MKRIILIGLLLASFASAQITPNGWIDQNSGTILKGSAFKAGLYGPLVDCPHAGAPYCGAPANTENFAGNEGNILDAQGGGAVDTIHNHIYFNGGGHNDYFGNQWYDYDVAAKTITRMSDPSQISNITYAQYNLDGTGVSAHSEQGLVYLPVEDAVFRLGIGAGPAPASQDFGWWDTTPRSNPTWVAKAANPVMLPYLMGSGATGCTPNSLQVGTFIGGGGTSATFSVWINGSGIPVGYGEKFNVGSGYTSLPTTATIATCTGTETLSGGQLAGGTIWTGGGDQGSMWVLDTSTYNPAVPNSESLLGINVGAGMMFRYTPHLDTGAGSTPYTTLAGFMSLGAIAFGTCAINYNVNPAVEVCVGAAPAGYPVGGIYVVPLSGAGAFQSTDITSSTTGCSALYSVVDPGFEFDSSTGLFVGYVGTGNYYILYDYLTQTCVTRQFSGGPTSSVQVPPTGAGYDRALAYFPKLNTFITIPNPTADAFSIQIHPAGLGASTLTCKDIDGDGYGVGPGCIGPDADDSDATVNTTATVLSKYGNVQTFLEHIGYQDAASLSTVYCVSPTGSGSTPSTNADTACTTPYPNWASLPTLSVPYIVLYRAGTWTTGRITLTSGTSSAQNVLLAYPGELPIIDFSGGSLGWVVNTTSTSYNTVDGFKMLGNSNGVGYLTGTFLTYPATGPILNLWNAVYRNDISNSSTDSNIDGDNEFDLDIEENVLHDPIASGGQHNAYLGANSSTGDIRVNLRRNIMYSVNTGFPSLQINGKCIDCSIDQNILYSANSQQIALLEGFSNGFIRNNLMFNTGALSNPGIGIRFLNYDSGQCQSMSQPLSICAYDQTSNVISNNTNLTETTSPFTGAAPSGEAVSIVNSTVTTPCGNGGSAPCGNMGGNSWMNNVFADLSTNSGGTGVTYYDAGNATSYLPLDTWINNLFQTGSSPTTVANAASTLLTCATLNSTALVGSGCLNADPKFVAANSSFWSSPSSFNLKPASGSPALAAGAIGIFTPALDILGNARSVTAPSIGAYELQGSSSPVAGCPTSTATIGVAYSSSFTVTGGAPAYTWAITTPSLPTGLSLNTSTGAVTGTPSGSAGVSSFTGTVTDSLSNTGSAACSITVGAALTASGGSLSGGLTLSGAGTIK